MSGRNRPLRERRSQTRQQLAAKAGEHLDRRRGQVVAVEDVKVGAPRLLAQHDALLDEAIQRD